MTTLQTESVSVWPSSNPTLHGELAAKGQPIKLLLVDDDDNFREAASDALSDLGFEVVGLSDGAPMFEFFGAGNNADVIVLDWKLRTGCGIDLLPQLRRRGIQLPVIFLTGMPATTHESAALDKGAMDFVDKTRGVEILAKRIRLIIEAGKKPP